MRFLVVAVLAVMCVQGALCDRRRRQVPAGVKPPPSPMKTAGMNFALSKLAGELAIEKDLGGAVDPQGLAKAEALMTKMDDMGMEVNADTKAEIEDLAAVAAEPVVPADPAAEPEPINLDQFEA